MQPQAGLESAGTGVLTRREGQEKTIFPKDTEEDGNP